jgi:hypothetical protein
MRERGTEREREREKAQLQENMEGKKRAKYGKDRVKEEYNFDC